MAHKIPKEFQNCILDFNRKVTFWGAVDTLFKMLWGDIKPTQDKGYWESLHSPMPYAAFFLITFVFFSIGGVIIIGLLTGN